MALAEQLDVAAVTRISQHLHLLTHRSKNQHRHSIWWRHFSVFKRQVAALEHDLVRLGEKPKTNVERVRLEKARPGITARIEQRIDAWPVARWYHAFSQLVADQAFAPLGLVLLSTLAEICAVTQTTERLEAQVEDVEPAQAPSVQEDLGHVVDRAATPPPARPKKQRKRKKQAQPQDAIDELFGGL